MGRWQWSGLFGRTSIEDIIAGRIGNAFLTLGAYSHGIGSWAWRGEVTIERDPFPIESAIIAVLLGCYGRIGWIFGGVGSLFQ